MVPIWGRQDPGGSHVGPMNLAIRVHISFAIFTDIVCLLTHWGRVTHISVGKQTIIGSDNGLSRGRQQTIIWTNTEEFIEP